MLVFHDSISVTEMQPREYKEFPCVSYPVSIVTSIQCSYGTVLIANSSTLKKKKKVLTEFHILLRFIQFLFNIIALCQNPFQGIILHLVIILS